MPASWRPQVPTDNALGLKRRLQINARQRRNLASAAPRVKPPSLDLRDLPPASSRRAGTQVPSIQLATHWKVHSLKAMCELSPHSLRGTNKSALGAQRRANQLDLVRETNRSW
eukprot:9488944-Pyramimonas_sp.AAC.1